jgi:hypothetical protein
MLTLSDALPRLAIDLVALAALTGGLFQPRHRRMDLVVVFALFNIGLFLALLILVGTKISLGVGFGLFAVLSIVRLRSDTYSHRELAYFFVALALALVCAVDLGDLASTAALAAILLLAAWVVDHPRLGTATRSTEVTLELVVTDPAALRARLEERLGVRIVDVTLLEVDWVRETTRAEVRYAPHATGKEAPDATVALAGR